MAARSSSACAWVKSADRPTFGSSSGAAASTALTSPASSRSICSSGMVSIASSSSPSVAAKSSATCGASPSGAGPGCCSTRVQAAARRRCDGSQWTGSAADASSSRSA
eukprot:scaffold5941_cov125-Isochrysis_galbana.AAC.1